MKDYQRVGVLVDFPEGRGRVVRVARKPVAIFNAAGTLYAVNDICPHLGGPISGGELIGTQVSCPYHGMCFDLRSGRSCDEFDHALQTYPVKVVGDEVYVRAWWAKRSKG